MPHSNRGLLTDASTAPPMNTAASPEAPAKVPKAPL